MTVIITWAAGAMLAAAAALLLVRIARGPTMLDRVVAMDVLVALVLCALGLEAAVNRHSTTLPILIALSLVGFLGAVSVAWFAGRAQPAADIARDIEPDGSER